MNKWPADYVESIAKDGYKVTCERLAARFQELASVCRRSRADNFHLRRAISLHRERIMMLGLGKDGHGTEWDRELWSALHVDGDLRSQAET